MKQWVLEEGENASYIWEKVDNGWRMIYNKYKAIGTWSKDIDSSGTAFQKSYTALEPTNHFTLIKTQEELFLHLL